MQYINVGDSIILNCQAVGTPSPEIVWFKDATDVQPTGTIGIVNDGTELRISNIRTEDIGDYTCIARNGEGQISHTARVLIAGGAVIMSPPTNQTKLEGEKVEFTCGAKAMPGNVTVRWSRDGTFVKSISSLETRVNIKKDGSMVINPVSADDSGKYLCEVSNGIGDPQSAFAYLNVECEYHNRQNLTATILVYVCVCVCVFRSSKSHIHADRSVFTVQIGWRRPVLYQSQSSVTVRHVDQRQTFAGALSAKRHRYHEQRFTAIYQGTYLKNKKKTARNRQMTIERFPNPNSRRSIKTTKADTRVHRTTHRVLRARPDRWKCW